MDTRTSGVADSTLALPQGGGGLSPLGQTFKVDLHSGGGSFAVPIELPEGRGALETTLNLQYSTGHGNGPFGLGWRIGLGDVSRKTSEGTPVYDDDEDTFVFSGGEDLVPIGNGLFRPHVESLFSRIQKVPAPDGKDCFIVTTRDGVRHIFGQDAASRFTHPERPDKVFRWLPSETIDPNGNRMVFGYKHEDSSGTENILSEQHRTHHQIYLSHIDYVNYTDDDTGERFLFKVSFDYGDLSDTGEQAGPWPMRPDPFSTFTPGFEVRTMRRCRRILLQVQPPGSSGYRVIRIWNLGYALSEPDGVSLLETVTLTGRRHEEAGGVQTLEEESYPPLSFGYTSTRFDEPRLIELTSEPGFFFGNSLDHPQVDMIDLNGNGLPDMIDLTRDRPVYWENRGGGRFSGPREVQAFPYEANRPGNITLLGDFDGTASADLYVQDGPRAKYYRNRFRYRFEEPVYLDEAPNLQIPGKQFFPMELNGDGAVDLLALSPDRRLYFHTSEPGPGGVPRQHFETARAVYFEPEGGNQLPLTQPVRFRLADMLGDGRSAMVFLSGGRVSYRPYVGNGRWGEEIVMGNAPNWPQGVDPKQVFLADLTGSGCADIVIIDGRQVQLAVNQNGNRFGDLHTIVHTPPIQADAVRIADVLGTGTAGLIFSLHGSHAGSNRHRFLDLAGPTRPRLLNVINNGFGGVVNITYRSAVEDWVRDEEAGTRRSSTLPISVSVVAAMDTRDLLKETQTHVEYLYHGGYYDGPTREFRGFSFTEEIETGDTNSPGILRRTWFHPGAELNLAGDPIDVSQDYQTPSTLFRSTLTLPPIPVHELERRAAAVRAVRGVHLRTDVFPLDSGGNPVGNPLVVTESAYEVDELLSPSNETQGIYAPHLMEAVTVRDENDGLPRKLKREEFSYDPYGNPVWKRMSSGPETPDPALPAVQTTEETRRIHTRDDPDPDPDLTVSYQVSYQVDRIFEIIIEEIDGGGGRKRISHQRHYYDGPDFVGQPLETLPTRGNPVRQEVLVLTDELIAKAYGAEVPEAALLSSGLVPEGVTESRLWWRQEKRYALDSGAQITVMRDALGLDTLVESDPAGWKIILTTTPGGYTHLAPVDYQALGIEYLVDSNLQETDFRYTPLGRPRSIIRRGRPNISGQYPGDTDALPTVAFNYNLQPVDEIHPIPNHTEIINRLTTGSLQVERTIEYVNGFGDLLQKRFEQNPGDIEGSESMMESWLVSGHTDVTARGFMHALYAPTIDSASAWRVTPEMRNTPVGGVIHDALGRPVRSTGPDGSIRLVNHGTWQTRLSDENDNANLTLDPAEPTQATLLARLSPQIDSPQVQTFDADDRVTEIIEDLGGGKHQRTRYRYDALGRPIEVIDALDRSAIRVFYDFTGQVIAFAQIDSGTHRFIFNAAQRLILRIDANGRRLHTTYDAAGRPFELYELSKTLPIAVAWDSPTKRLITRTTYGAAGDSAALTANACGKVMQVLDPVGFLEKTYDRQGNKASTSRRFFASDPNSELDPDWVPPSVNTRLLEGEQYRIDYAHDATSRLHQVTYPSVNGGFRPIVTMQRTLLGLLKQVDYRPDAGNAVTSVISDTLYNTRNARVATWMGNGQAVAFGYGADNPRLSEITVGPAAVGTLPATNLLFSINYDYDLVGNPLEVTRFNGTDLRSLADDGRTSTEVSSFAYDALHRLTGSSVFDTLTGNRKQSARNYRYDIAENLIDYEDRTGPHPQINSGTNRLSGFALPGQPIASPLSYDPGGSLTSAPHLTNLVWDERGHLGHLTHTSGRQARYSYDVYGERRRRLIRDGNRILEIRSVDGIFEVETEVENTTLIKHQTRIHIMGTLERQAIVVNDLLSNTERIFYLHGDHLTSVLCVTDDTGAPVTQKDYLPYGLIAGSSGANFERGFAGLATDMESGLIYMSLRYYDPSIGRFLSPDPYMIKYLDGRNAQGIYRPGNLNPYVYAAGNPLVFYDPTGGFIITAILIGAGIVAGGLALAGVGQAMQGSGNAIVRGFGKAFEVIGLIAAGAVLATVGAALVPIGLLFASPLLLIPVVGPLAFGALAVVAALVMVAAPITGIAHGAITGAFGVYDLSNPSGYLAFIADTTWGLSQTTLGVIGITVAAIGGGSVNRGLSNRTNVLAMEAGFGGGGLSLGPYIFAGSTFAADPELFAHESTHTMQNRIFGPIFTFTVIPMTAISNIMTAIAPPASNPGFVDAGEPPNWDNWINWWEAWAEAAVP